MPDDGSGVYNIPAGTLVSTGDTVLPSQHNPWANDSATAISNRYSKDGRAPLTGNMNVNNFRLTNLSDPSAAQDAANKRYVDDQITAVNQNAEKIVGLAANYTALLADKATSFRFTAVATFSLTAAATLLNGWWCEVWNNSTGNVTIDPNGAETINGAATLIVQSGQAAKVFCTGTAFVAEVTGDPLSGPQLQGYSFGLALTTNVTDAANDVDIAVGSAASDVSPYNLMQLGTAITKRIDANWAVGTNQGGLDTGAVSAAATYYIWLIQRSDTLVVDMLFSLSNTAPTMPANYDRKRLLSRVVRVSSVNGSPQISGRFVSSPITTPAIGGLVQAAHGLQLTPEFIEAWMVCVNSEGGWSPGEKLPIGFQTIVSGTDGRGIQVWADATNIYGRIGDTNFAIAGNKTTGAGFAATPANWNVILKGHL